jgi:hypothetical protein
MIDDSAPKLFPCACCGHITLEESPGNYEICPVCFWEDDGVQLRYPTLSGGANEPSLIEAQANYRAFGASEERFIRNVRDARASEEVEKGWRPIEPETDRFERKADADWPKDLTTLYWWRPTYWRASGT